MSLYLRGFGFFCNSVNLFFLQHAQKHDWARITHGQLLKAKCFYFSKKTNKIYISLKEQADGRDSRSKHNTFDDGGDGA